MHDEPYLYGGGWAAVCLAGTTLLGVTREQTLRCAQQQLLQNTQIVTKWNAWLKIDWFS